MNDPKPFKMLGDCKVPTYEELRKHFSDNFHIENGRLVPNTTQPIIVDYLITL